MKPPRNSWWLLFSLILVAGATAFFHLHSPMTMGTLSIQGVKPGMARTQIEKIYGKAVSVPVPGATGPWQNWTAYRETPEGNPTNRMVCVQYYGDVAYAVYGDHLEKSGRPFLSRATKADCEKLLGKPAFKGSYSPPVYRWENLQLTVWWPEDSPTEDCPMFTLEPVHVFPSESVH